MYITFTAKVGLATYAQNQSSLLGYQTTPQPPDWLPVGGDGPTTLYICLTPMSIRSLWSSREIIPTQTFFFFIMDWRGGVLIKHDKNIIYFKSKSMNLPKAITIYHSVSHVMIIVILTCRTFLFSHHLCINWIVRGRAGHKRRVWNAQCLHCYLYHWNILMSGRY